MQRLRTLVVMLAAWIVTLAAVLWLYAEFRETGAVSIAGTQHTGRTALAILVVCAAVPITLLAVALQKLAAIRAGSRP